MPATFYFDLASPYSYLAAERVDGLFAEVGLEPPRWQPILFGALLTANSLHAMRAATVAAGIGPEVTEGIAAPETKAKLRAATEEAWAAGLQGVPTVAVAEQLFWGDGLAEAVAAASA